MVKRLITAFLFMGISATTLEAQSWLKGNPSVMLEQARKRENLEYDLMKNPAMLKRYVKAGYFVKVTTTKNYVVDKQVSFRYARPGTKLFLDRFGAQYRAACGERPVIVSLTRTLDRQPRNASKRSVHPAGMSVDFRVPRNFSCLEFMKATFNLLENRVTPRVLQVTREYHPAHFHVAVYPDNYKKYLDGMKKPKKTTKKAPVKKSRR